MAQLTVKINGYAYTIGCEDGQEQHLQDMAQDLDARVESAKAMGGATGEGRLLVIAALLMADELHDLRLEMGSLRAQAAARPATPGQLPAAPVARPDTKRIARIARKAEDIAARLEQS
jgi:cell division protein ZapA